MKQVRNAMWLVPVLLLNMVIFNHVPAIAKTAEVAQKPSNAQLIKVDLNKATLEELETIRGIGPALAERIVTYRNENGKFKSAEDLMNVKGIGSSKFEKIKEQLMV